jgi:hypothetical protein
VGTGLTFGARRVDVRKWHRHPWAFNYTISKAATLALSSSPLFYLLYLTINIYI